MNGRIPFTIPVIRGTGASWPTGLRAFIAATPWCRSPKETHFSQTVQILNPKPLGGAIDVALTEWIP